MELWLHSLILALVQGLTEFLPVSSSGHLVLIHALMPNQQLNDVTEKIMDIAVHTGTLVAVMLYFRSELMMIIRGGLKICINRHDHETKLALMIMLASIPVILIGAIIALNDIAIFDSLHIMAWMTLIFGAVLIVIERLPIRYSNMDDLGWKHALIIGLAQCLALIPGVSRSGITMTAARGLGFDHIQAARFSMLIGMVAIAGAGVMGGISLTESDQNVASLLPILTFAAVMSCVSAFIAIAALMKFFAKFTLAGFGYYRLVLGAALLAYLYI